MDSGTILLVDDNAQILSVLSDLLRPLGHRVLTAASGVEALQQAAEHRPDLVLLDVMMPDMDGFTVCRRLRADPELSQVPVILITALDDRASRVQGFEAGADDFISKPFDYTELRVRINTVLRLNRYRLLLDEQARSAAARARFDWVVEQSDDGYVIINVADDLIRYANPQARALFGLEPGSEPLPPFAEAASRLFRLVPSDAWANWPAQVPSDEIRYLMRQETPTAPEAWLRADLLGPHPGDETTRVLRLRDVTAQITSQREMWTFHALLTHKLRTPLVSIIGGLNILSDETSSPSDEVRRRIARLALDGARRLQGEIEDVLHYLRPPADLYGNDACLIEDLTALAEGIAAELGIALRVPQPLPDHAERLLISRHSMEVVLRELFENARKFHPQRNPEIEISVVATHPRWITLCITDNGTGLSPSQLMQAWRPYYQGEKNFTGQVEGMGLGLALVARIVLAVGGDYQLTNRPEGSGARVLLRLPFAHPQA
ncbi:MAG: hybrid sensor histidine kinase/response regulator [Oscillochloris sp.]|nr:hybrid sensor histidine kinase/response regulator [Oscillochloris sp.]